MATLVRLLTLHTAFTAGAEPSTGDREDPTVANTLHRLVGSLVNNDTGTIRRAADRQELKVINIGLARTATSSFVTAMMELGLKSYHMKDGVQDTEGHADLWIDHAALALNENGELKPGWRTDAAVVADRKRVFDRLAKDGFNATADMPVIAYYRELIARYPKALVVLCEHPSGSGERWAASVRATIGRNQELFSQRPWTWIPMVQGFMRFEEWNWKALGSPPRRGERPAFDATELAQFYAKWNVEAEQWVKAKGRKLLKFKATDGWAPLCKFVRALGDASVDAKCDALLAAGAPYPAANVDLRNVYAVLGAITTFFQLPIIVLALFGMSAVALMRTCCMACYRRGWRASKEKKMA